MKYETIIQEFITSFPELKQLAQDELNKTWHREEQLVHVFFGNILNKYLVEKLSSTKNDGLFKRLFEFLELMAVSDDKQVREVLTDSILEYLGDNKEILDKARSLMGSETLKLSHEVEKSWGRE